MSTMVESEMKEFFQRVIDSVAELSSQAARVEGLVQQVQQLTERINQFELDNRTLMSQVNNANDRLNETTNALNQTQSYLDQEKAVTAALRDTITQRDAGVVALEQSFRNEQDAHKLTTSERDDARTKIGELERENQDTHNQLNDLYTDRDSWRTKAIDLEATNANLKQQIGQIQSVLNPLRVVSQDVQSA
jgi:chromosome segregation ATPase